MFRTTATRAIPSTLAALRTPATRTNLARVAQQAAFRTSTRPANPSRVLALAVQQPIQKSLVRYASSKVVLGQDTEGEKKLQSEKVIALPELVSTDSSVHNLTTETGAKPSEDDVDMMAGVRSDFNTIVETFSLKDVPTKAMYMGLAGVVPYLATSLSTVVLSFDIQYAATHGQGLLFSGNVSEQLLHIIEPLQLGYGASIISFLGAIHWGLEWAKYGGEQGYPRYAIGVLATAVAWPTLLLSAEVGLITQFLAFTFLYYTDSRASRAGWAPRWYGIYRFVLTFIVGVSIVASLIGRGQIADLISKPVGPADRLRALREEQLAQLEADDAENKARLAGGDEEDEDEEEDEE
ncbi:hypothetical protein H2198_004037 [Neophaeococcomyces mojaviensis]|uniref:Uncharacterized protein n=1 Tax=Neophaeococcomyces mojaviensis TaxID=3383035 RepID=A0ACC3A9N0_9EURO|nr:hypothetical protein H2198_004037 [Knufia sp. JES_112]